MMQDEHTGKSAAVLREEIAKIEAQLQDVKTQLAHLEGRTEVYAAAAVNGHQTDPRRNDDHFAVWRWPLSAAEYDRYGRQLILPQIGIQGQKRLKSAKVLIIGAGGLGCPAAAYLAGAGVGTMGFVDGDVVEPSNLHRQIAHGTSRVGQCKVDSLVTYCKELNPLVTYAAHREHFTPQNAATIMQPYDLVLDCTDHPTSRYLISDATILLQKPLVSASALRTDGQLLILNTPPTPQTTIATFQLPQPPCYRCIFPKPPPPETAVSCGAGGVLGPVVGVMGVLQALEAIKILAAGLHLPPSPATATAEPVTMLLFSGSTIGAPNFRAVRMRSRRRDCFACGEGSDARLTLETLRSGSLDYVAFCGGLSGTTVKVLGEEARVDVREYVRRVEDGRGHLLLDVREKELFDVASIEGAINVPYSKIQSTARRKRLEAKADEENDGDTVAAWMPPNVAKDAPIYVVCRVGNDSQKVVKQLLDLGLDGNGERWIGDIRGGMKAWRDHIDGTLPFL